MEMSALHMECLEVACQQRGIYSIDDVINDVKNEFSTIPDGADSSIVIDAMVRAIDPYPKLNYCPDPACIAGYVSENP